jgi:N-acetylneuraminic acid mutarotase
MALHSLKRLVILFMVGMLVGPSLTTMPSGAGSSIIYTASDFANGTGKGTIVIPDGVELGVEKEYLNNWTMLDQGEPGVRFLASMAFDERLGEFVLFGSDDVYWAPKGKVWTYNLTTEKWTDMRSWDTSGVPQWLVSTSVSYSMVYDNLHGMIIAFGSEMNSSGGFDPVTWTYNLSNNQWTKKNPSGMPPVRLSFSMAFDRDRGEAIIFGGHIMTRWGDDEIPPHFNDTWAYNLSTNTWSNKTPANSPPGLCNHSMVYDSANKVFVLFGGRNDTLSNETWTYNPTTNNWNKMNPITAPSPRQYSSMVYDPVKKQTLLYGGSTPTSSNEMWSYNYTNDTWIILTPAVRPPALAGTCMGYDGIHDKIILYGGASNYGYFPGKYLVDTWKYNSTSNNWTVRGCRSPQPRSYSFMAYDESAGETILFSGGSGIETFYDTWTFNLSTKHWSNKKPTNYPPYYGPNEMNYDSKRGEMIFTGWEYQAPNDFTYYYNLSTNTWTDRRPIATFLPIRTEATMAYDKRADRTILFGGAEVYGRMLNDTWSYDYSNNTWINMSPPTAPSPREAPRMVYLESSSEILLYGGADWTDPYYKFNDTWRYNFTTNTWTNVTKSITPPNTWRHTMAYDSVMDEVILMGGDYGIADQGNRTWRFMPSTNTWRQIPNAITPPVTSDFRIVFDREANETILFGGFLYTQDLNGTVYNGYKGETWVMNHRVLYKEGNHTSQAIDLGGPARLGTLNWSSDVPEGTGIRLQLRMAETNASLQLAPFVGPDGTAQTYYNHSGQTISNTHNGSRWIQYRAYLNTTYDLLSPVLISVNITYNLLPEMPILNLPSNGEWTNNSRPTFSWTSQDNDSSINGFEWQMDDSLLFNSVNYSSGQMVSMNSNYQPTAPIADGTWYWRVRALDNDSDWGPFSGPQILRIDTRPPGPFQPVADPKEWTNGTIQLTFNTTDSAIGMDHYEIYIDGVSQGMQASPFTLPSLSDGEHNITVKAYDLLWNSISSGVKVYQDRTPPQAFTPTAEPSGWTNSSPLISFNTSDETSGIDRYEVSMDQSAFMGQTSPWSLPELTDGQHNITIRAYDVAGNSRDASLVVSIDRTRPFNFTVTSDFTNWINKNPNITFQALDNMSMVDHFEAKLPDGNFTVQTSPYQLPDLPDGRHNITIRVYDKASNYAEAVFQALIDRTPPADFTPIANPDVWTNRNPNITFSTIDNTSGVSRYEVGIAGGAFSTRASPFQLANLSDGQHQVVVRAYDTAGNYREASATVFIDKTPPVQIQLRINEGEKSTKSKEVTLFIAASDAFSGLNATCFSNDGIFFSDWEPFTTSKEWNLTAETGSKSVYIKVKDKAGNEADPVSASIKYALASTETRSDIMPLLAIVLVLIIAMGVGAIAWRVSRKGKAKVGLSEPQEEEPKQAPKGPVSKEVPPPKIEPEKPTPKPAPAVQAKVIEEQRKKEILLAAEAKKTKETRPEAKAAPPVPAKAPAIAAPEGFAVEDVFLMYKDGRLILHTTRRMKADMDVDIMTSMLTAVQEFVKESMGREEGAELGSMEYGGNKILFEKGRWVIISAVITGGEPSGFRDEMKSVLRNVESEFAAVLPAWDGIVTRLVGAKRFMAQLGAYRPAEETAAGKPMGDVSLKAELEFYQGFVRLKVAVKNAMPTMIAKATFKLIYNDGVFRLDHIEPELERTKDEVSLGIVEPGEKRTVAFYLDPQICTESYIEGVLTFKDAQGGLHTLMMPRKLASVVCPILYTEENINTAMLKRMAAEELDKKDAKVFSIPPAITHQKAFEIGKAAVQHHDLRLVRELVEKEPYIAEAWYYGKAKGRDDRLVVRVRVLKEQQVLEFHVASSSTLMLTGMLAELKSDLNDELSLKQVRGGMEQVTDARKVDALQSIMSLLDKASEQDGKSVET